MKSFIETLEKPRWVAVGGACLAASLIMEWTGTALSAVPAWATAAICGLPIGASAASSLVRNRGIRRITSPLLISIAILAAILTRESFAAGEVALIMAIGEFLEEKTTRRARRGIEGLIALAPTRARVVGVGGARLVPIGEVTAGDVVRVLPGEAIPVDGEIVLGETSVDPSIVTGESLPVDAGVGDAVYCGTLNRHGSVDVRAARVGEDSSLHRLVRLAREAERGKAPSQRIADAWAAWLVPAALLIAAAAYGVTRDPVRAVTVLVVFCPCALTLATPTSIMAAIGQAARRGVIVKSGAALERMGKADRIAFDKTGTITRGAPAVCDVLPIGGARTPEELLALAASAEARSEHPLGEAIAARAAELALPLPPAEGFRMTPGRGVSARVGGEAVLCGNEAQLKASDAVLGEEGKRLSERLRGEGKAVVLVAVSGEPAGFIALADPPREGAAEAIAALKRLRAEPVLLTGDHARTAARVAELVGIGEARAGLLPEEKVEWIRAMIRSGRTVAMVGDGVNDAPALKAADVGIAMGVRGSDLAVEAADIALMGDDLAAIPYLKRLSNAVARQIQWNVGLSLGVNFAAIALSALGLLTPATGALMHNAGALLVILGAAMLYGRRFD